MKALIINLAIILAVASTLQAGEFAGGTGTAHDPFQVANAAQLNNVRNYPGMYFVQTAHIDLNVAPFNMGNYWIPIGGYRSNNSVDRNFIGHYDGNGFQISNMIIVQPSNRNIGLFGHIGRSDDGATTLRNIHLRNVIVIGGTATGALAGRVTGNQNTRIENCSAEFGYVRGDAGTGGLVGTNNSYMTTSVASEGFRPVIFKSWADVSVMLRSEYSEGKMSFGGLVGCNQKGMISHCYSVGEVIINDKEASYVGGLAGCIDNRGAIINSYSATAVIADSVALKGGLVSSIGVGRNKGIVINSYWNTDVNTPDLKSVEGIGLTSAEMRKSSSFQGWDFFNVWQISQSINNGFPVTINSHASKTLKEWAGTFSSNFNDPLNWVPEGIPGASDRIYVSASTIYQPVLSSSVTVHDLVLEDNATLTLKEKSVVLTITGALSGGEETVGTANIRGEGALVMAGSTLQNIPAMIFDNLVVDNPNNVQLTGSIFVYGTLKMGQGLLDLRGFDVNLGENAQLLEVENENMSSRIYGKAGVIRTIRNLNAPEGDIAGLGLEIISKKDLGISLIERGHSPLNEGDESKSILRWFNIEPANNSNLEATMIFRYFISELNIYGENDNFSLFKRKKGDTEWIWIASDLDAANRTLTAYGLNEFSTWTAGSTDKPLPIVLIHWDAKPVHQYVDITWITGAEINNDFFTIERSTDGVNFSPIATINGKGTTSQTSHYSWVDHSPLSGISYYRLKQTDFNGQFEYSSLVSVYTTLRVIQKISIYPNPSNGNFNIRAEADRTISFQVIDLQGRVVYSGTAEPGMVNQVSLHQLNKGVYSVIFMDEEKTTERIHII